MTSKNNVDMLKEYFNFIDTVSEHVDRYIINPIYRVDVHRCFKFLTEKGLISKYITYAHTGNLIADSLLNYNIKEERLYSLEVTPDYFIFKGSYFQLRIEHNENDTVSISIAEL